MHQDNRLNSLQLRQFKGVILFQKTRLFSLVTAQYCQLHAKSLIRRRKRQIVKFFQGGGVKDVKTPVYSRRSMGDKYESCSGGRVWMDLAQQHRCTGWLYHLFHKTVVQRCCDAAEISGTAWRPSGLRPWHRLLPESLRR